MLAGGTNANGLESMAIHPLRNSVLYEVHARPFIPVSGSRRLLHFAFLTNPDEALADRRELEAHCIEQGQPSPSADSKHHFVRFSGVCLRWEQHSEFTTYTWDFESTDSVPFAATSADLCKPMLELPQPGPLLATADLHLISDDGVVWFEKVFDPASLAVSLVDGETAYVATDFKPDRNGVVRILVVDRGMTDARAGALVQRLLEIETYRILALLGLPEAQRLSPAVREIEDALTRIARSMAQGRDLATDNALLEELTRLAAAVEADANVSGYRLSASRAYDSIVQQRLAAIGETSVPSYPNIAAFLSRRMAPAMRTCHILESRLGNLSHRLARAAQLLRTRVDVEIEQQNRDLLATMNERVRLQLRLQEAVEGLSVAAISYYIISLLGYVFKGLKDAGSPIDPGLVTAASVPIVTLAIALLARSVRRKHSDRKSTQI